MTRFLRPVAEVAAAVTLQLAMLAIDALKLGLIVGAGVLFAWKTGMLA